MPEITSPHWSAEGVCTKHMLPRIPCTFCLMEHDPDVEVRLTEADRTVLDFDPDAKVELLLPEEHASWLMKRIVS